MNVSEFSSVLDWLSSRRHLVLRSRLTSQTHSGRLAALQLFINERLFPPHACETMWPHHERGPNGSINKTEGGLSAAVKGERRVIFISLPVRKTNTSETNPLICRAACRLIIQQSFVSSPPLVPPFAHLSSSSLRLSSKITTTHIIFLSESLNGRSSHYSEVRLFPDKVVFYFFNIFSVVYHSPAPFEMYLFKEEFSFYSSKFHFKKCPFNICLKKNLN